MSSVITPPQVTNTNQVSSPPRPIDVPVWRTRTRTTPGRLWLAFGAVCVSLLVLWLVADASINRTRQAIQTIGKDSVPSIVAAQQIRAYMADMNASSANVFISTGNNFSSGNNVLLKGQYDQQRAAANDNLISAAQNITYGNAERTPILAITDGLETYNGLIKAARTKGRPYGIKDLIAASDLMHSTLIPAADTLDQVNFDHLNTAYETARKQAAAVQIGLYAAGGLVLAALLVTQVYLMRRTRRVLNLPLVLATVLLAGFVGGLSSALAAQNEDLRAAKEDCFDSIHALWKARSVAYDANADESLYLLGPATRAQYDASFRAKAKTLADVDITPAVVAAAASGAKPTFPGSLGVELRNITFVGEQAAATETLSDWGKYLVLDTQIRALETSGQHSQAIALCTGAAPGQSDYAFSQFDAALGKTLGINQDQFDQTVAKTFSGLRPLPAFAAASVLLMIVLTWLGLAPRLREYQG
jgi:CHASE3 domain sensor protein